VAVAFKDGVLAGIEIDFGALGMLVFPPRDGDDHSFLLCLYIGNPDMVSCARFASLHAFTIDKLLDYLESLEDYELKVVEHGGGAP